MDNKTLTWQQRVWKWIGDFVYGIRPLLLYLLLPPAISAFGLFIAGLKEHIEFFLWRSGWAALLWLVYNVLGNVSFIVIQRYNRPRLQKLAEKTRRRPV